MVLINGTALVDETAFRKLGQITSCRHINRQIASRQIDRFKAAKQKGEAYKCCSSDKVAPKQL